MSKFAEFVDNDYGFAVQISPPRAQSVARKTHFSELSKGASLVWREFESRRFAESHGFKRLRREIDVAIDIQSCRIRHAVAEVEHRHQISRAIVDRLRED